MRRIFALLTAAFLISGLTGCGAPREAAVQVFAMDTVMQLTASGGQGEAALAEAQREIYRMESLLSRTREESQVTMLNRAGGAWTEIDPVLADLLAEAENYRQMTGGAFDVTIAPVADAWGFAGEEQRVPDRETLAEALALVDGGRMSLDLREGADFARLGPGQRIDLGGIVKGYLSDRMAELYGTYEVPSGIADLGGNVYVRGTREDGEPWRVGVRDPRNPAAGAYAGVLLLEDAFAVTSGGYQRYFTENGETYHHILDPATGYPAQSGLLSVTVVAEAAGGAPGNGTMCDALSTALFVLGEERALDLWRSSGGAFDLVLVTEEGRVVVTAGLKGRFEETEHGGVSYETVS